MELIGALSNPETGALLDGVGKALDDLGSKLTKHHVAQINQRPVQGEILRTMTTVLAEAPAGLRTIEVRRQAEARLGRELPPSTVKGMLAGKSRFERLSRGRYRLRRT